MRLFCSPAAKEQRAICKEAACSVLLEDPQRFGSADDRGRRNRAEVSAVERQGFVLVHEEDLACCDHSAALPDRKRATESVTLACRSDLDPVDGDEQVVAADDLSGKGK